MSGIVVGIEEMLMNNVHQVPACSMMKGRYTRNLTNKTLYCDKCYEKGNSRCYRNIEE